MSRTAAPIAVSTAPTSKPVRNHRSRISPAGIASTTYRSGKTWASHPIALSDTPYRSAATVVTPAKLSQTNWVAAPTSANAPIADHLLRTAVPT
jgi:hypothetical protein